MREVKLKKIVDEFKKDLAHYLWASTPKLTDHELKFNAKILATRYKFNFIEALEGKSFDEKQQYFYDLLVAEKLKVGNQ